MIEQSKEDTIILSKTPSAPFVLCITHSHNLLHIYETYRATYSPCTLFI